MSEKIIAIEKRKGPLTPIFEKVMQMVPDRDRQDEKLQRLIAFRLGVDGEAATREYLIGKIRDVIQCGYTGSFYDFIKDNLQAKKCGLGDDILEPLDA